MRSPMGPMRTVGDYQIPGNFRKEAHAYMISSLRTSRSPAMNSRGGRPPRYERAGLTRGCFNRPLGAYNWICCVTLMVSPVAVCNESLWSASRKTGNDVVDVTPTKPGSAGSVSELGTSLSEPIGRAAWGVREDPFLERR
jgi:hypothetical protein